MTDSQQSYVQHLLIWKNVKKSLKPVKKRCVIQIMYWVF